MDGQGEAAAILVEGLSAETLEAARQAASLPQEEAWLQVFTGERLPDAEAGRPSVLGSIQVEDEGVRFLPRYPLMPGQSYAVRWAPPGGPGHSAVLVPPRNPAPSATRLTAIYPSADELPANLLKVYLHFSAPMSRGEAAQRVRLLDEAGDEIEAPFVAPDVELWNEDRTRLTLFFDPGRIKQGVGPNLEAGPPLEEGRSYRLIVDANWPDGAGGSLEEGAEKRFRTSAADHRQPRSESWELVPPPAADAPVTLRLTEAMDHALLERLLAVVDDAGRGVEGRVEISAGETLWTFRPREAWRSGSYSLRVQPELEDLAGNSLRRAFDTPMRSGAGSEGGGVGEERPEPLSFPFTGPPEKGGPRDATLGRGGRDSEF